MIRRPYNRDAGSGRMRRYSALGVVACAAALLPLAGCSNILHVDDPDVATTGSLENEASLPVLLAGALSDFQVAYGGYAGAGGSSGEGEIDVSGLLADEMLHVGTFPTRQQIDQRKIFTDNGQLDDVFRELQRARVSADRAVRVYNQFQPTAPGAALAHALEGYTYIFLAENWCSGVPVSTVTESGETQYSPPRSTDDLLNLALAQFDSASSIASAAGSDAADYGNLALVGKARALVDQNKLSDAAQVASSVPDDFEFLIQHSENTTTEYNGVWYMNQNTGRYSVVSEEGGNGLPYLQSPADPRVPWDTAARKPFDTTISLPLLEQLKYPDRGSPTVLANGVEARLIEAEAKLDGGNSAAYLPILNDLRATVELAALGDPGSPAARVDQFFQERAFWLWLTSHRLGDMRRLIKYYDRTADEVYPTGDYYRAGTVYGDDVSLPVPITEDNNPEYKKAASTCDPTKA